jgi:hypothetical protein
MDTAFFSSGSKLEEVTMLNAPVTNVPRTATYKIDYRNNNLINKPTIPTLPAEITDAQVDSGVGTDEVLMTPTKAKAMIEKHSTGHTPVMVSATDFTTVALALADDAVKNATAGDFVRVTGDIYLIIKTSPTVSADLVSIDGDADLSALATKAELASGLADKLNLDTYLIGQSLPGVPVTDGIEMAYFPKLPLTTLGVGNKVTATIDPKNGRQLVQADTAKQPTFLLDKHNKYYYDIALEQSLVSEGNISARSLGGATGTTTSFMFVFTPEVYVNNTQFMWGTESSAKRLSVHLMRDSAGKLVIDHGSNLGGGRYSIPTSNLVAGKVNSLLYVRNGTTAEVWINGVTQGSKTVGNNLPTDDTALPFSIGVMVGNDNYKSALKFNALFFYGRALTEHERTLMFAYSKKEYESIDPVELPPQITLTQARTGAGTDPILFTPTSAKDMIEIHSTQLPPEITDFQVVSGIGRDAVLPTPEKLKRFVLDHYSKDYLTFEIILNNLRSWNVSRAYSSTGVLNAIGFSKIINGTERRIEMNHTYNANGSINNIDMTGDIPNGVDTRKHYSYDISGRINEISYSTP